MCPVCMASAALTVTSAGSAGGLTAPGLSVFCKNGAGEVFHAYSTYGRGLEDFMGVYRFLDVMPKGRNEEGLAHSMAWVRHHDRYDTGKLVELK